MKWTTFNRTACSNISNKTFKGNLKIITIEKEIMEGTIETKIEKKQILHIKKVMKPTM